MEKYLRHEPAEKLGKKARLPSGGRRSQWGELFSPTKCQSVDDILTIKEEVLDIKLEMSDQGMIQFGGGGRGSQRKCDPFKDQHCNPKMMLSV